MQTFEAILIAVVLVTSVAFVVTLEQPTAPSEAARHRLGERAEDTLGIMYETPLSSTAYGDSWISRAVAVCLNTRDCSYLTEKLDRLLPPGTRYNVWLNNGYEDLPVYVPDLPRGETVVSLKDFEPKWSYTFLGLDFNHTDAEQNQPLTVFALPIQNSNVATEGGTPVVVFVNGTRSDGGNVSLSAAATTIQVKAEDAARYQSASVTFRDWDGGVAGVIDVRNVTADPVLGTPTGTPVTMRLRVDNAVGAASVPAGAKIRIDLPRDWSAVAEQSQNAGWRVLANASDYNATYGASHVEASLVESLDAGESLDFVIRGTYRGTVKDYYLFVASFGHDSHARAEVVVRANALPVASRVDYPAAAFTVPKPMGATQARPWALGLTAPLLDETGVQEVAVYVTRVEVFSPDGYDLFDGASVVPGVNTADGEWTKVGTRLVWTGNGTASRDNAFELTWTVEGAGTKTPTDSRTSRQVPIRFDNDYAARLVHQVLPSMYWGEVYSEDALGRPGYEATFGLTDVVTSHPYRSNPVFRTTPLWGFDNYTVGGVVSFRDASAGGYVRASDRNVPLGEEVTLTAEVQSLLLRLAQAGATATATMRLYPPYAIDAKLPVWENSTLETGVTASDVTAIALRDLTGDGVDDVVVGTSAGRVLTMDGRNGQRVPGYSFSVPAIAGAASAVTHLLRATVDGNDVILVATDASGPYVHALDGDFDEIYRWNKTSAGAVLGIDASVDVNGDGVTDVLVALDDWRVYALDGDRKAHGYFETLSPPASPADAHWVQAPGAPDGGLVGLGTMGHWKQAGFAVGVSSLSGTRSNATPPTADPLSVLDVVASVPVPRTGLLGVNENGTALWSLSDLPASGLLTRDVNGDGVDDVIAGTTGGYVLALNGTQAAPPLTPLVYGQIGDAVSAHAVSPIEAWFLTSLGNVVGTDDGFVTAFCSCDPATGLPVPVAGALGVSVDPSDGRVWVVGTAGAVWRGDVNEETRTVSLTPGVWNVDTHLRVRGCAPAILPCLFGIVTLDTHTMNDVYFRWDGKGFVVGDACALTCSESLVLKRDSAGDDWVRLSKDYKPSGTGTLLSSSGGAVTASLKKINFTTASVGWILGASGTLLRTTDGGDHWRAVPLPAALSAYTLTDISCVPSDPDRCWFVATDGNAAGETTVLYRTTSATTTTSAADWTVVDTGVDRVLRSVSFSSEDVGYVGGENVVLATWNGGDAWTKLPMAYVEGTMNEAHAFPGGDGFLLGGDGTNGGAFTLRDHVTTTRAESGVAWSCAGDCAVTDVTLVADGSYVGNLTDTDGAWAQYWVTTSSGDAAWAPLAPTAGALQYRGSEAYDPLELGGSGGDELRWRADLHVAHNLSGFSPVIRSLTFHVNYTVDGVAQPTATVVEDFASTAGMSAARTTADWNSTLGVLRASRVGELWAQDVGGVALGLAQGDVTGDGVPDVAVGTGAILALNDPANWLTSGADLDAVVGTDGRVHLLDGAAGGARLWRTATLAQEVRHVAVADLAWPHGAPDAYKDVIAVAWNETESTGEIVALAGADGAVIWRTELDGEPSSLGVGEASDGASPLPVVGTEGGVSTPGYAYAHDREDGALVWRGVPEERGHYNLTVGIPRGIPLGPYVVEFELSWQDTVTRTIGGLPVTDTVVQAARFYDYFNVVPPAKPLPVSPIYTLKLVTWLGDWDYVTTTRTTNGDDVAPGGPSASGEPDGTSLAYDECLLEICHLAGGTGWLFDMGIPQVRDVS